MAGEVGTIQFKELIMGQLYSGWHEAISHSAHHCEVRSNFNKSSIAFFFVLLFLVRLIRSYQ